jgi:hypothetical protein
MKTRTKIILWTLPLLVIILTYIYIYVIGNGLNVAWEFVGKPSENISKIIGFNFNPGKLYVFTDSGEIYSLPYYHYDDPIPSPSQWVKDENYKKELDPISVSSYVPIEFPSPPPPFNVKQIYQVSFPAIESTNVTKFALSEDGNLWFWRAAGSGLQGFFYSLVLAIEILAYILAVFIYFVIYLMKRMLSKLNNKTPDTQ